MGKENSPLSIWSKAIPLFFFRLASSAFPDIGSVGRVEKKNLKKRRPGTPASLFRAQKQQDMNPKSIWRKSWLLSL